MIKLIRGEMCRMGRHGVSRRSAHRCSRPASHRAINEVCQQAQDAQTGIPYIDYL
ncbi:Uncharacterised protein [Yersinia aleksiciae]|nr:Uncharacterised protein [Yersinia aleksiciae]